MKKNRKWCRRRDNVTLIIIKALLWPYFFFRMGFRFKKAKMDRDRPYLVLCNHETFWDPFFVSMVYNRPIHFMATDNIFTNGFSSRLLTFFLGPIPKRKQGGDLQAVRAAIKIAKENGVVGVFPEGSTTYDGYPTSIDIGAAKLAKIMKADLLLCNIDGGYGCDPRWSRKPRKGHLMVSEVRRLTREEMEHMSDEELHEIVVSELAVSPPPSKYTYRSNARAEWIESAVYICPKCGAVSSIVSSGNNFSCTACGLTGTYNEDLSLTFSDDSVGITTMREWLELQKSRIETTVTEYDQYIFEDDGVKFTISDRNIGKRIVLGIGKLRLDRDALSFCISDGTERTLELSDVEIVSPVTGRKLIIATRENTYFVIGPQAFNPYKYAQAFYYLKGEPDREVK